MSRDSVVHLDSIGADVRIDVHVGVGEHRGAQAEPPAPPVRVEPPLRAGCIVGGRYELVRLLGRGSMGTVWQASHTSLGEQVALKLMSPIAESDAVEDASTTAARFRFEAQIAARLSRKTRHVVRVTDHGQEGPLPYLVMELLEGQTLEKALLCRGPMGVDEVSTLVAQIARGLEAAHAEGVLHRDLKPANVFLADSGEGRPVVKLLDFGVARGHSSQRLGAPFVTAKGLIVGTPGYMSPEQAAASEIDVRSDVWSLAAIAYEALTCELPIAGSDAEDMLFNLRACRTVPVRDRRPDLPESLEPFFQRAFAPRIDDRHATCAELAQAFAQAAHLGVVPAVTRRLLAPLPRRLPGVEPAGRARPRRYARFAAVAFLACAALFATWYASGSGRSKAASRDPTEALAASPLRGQGAAARSKEESVPAQATIPTAPPAVWTHDEAQPPPTTPKATRRPTTGELGEFMAYY